MGLRLWFRVFELDFLCLLAAGVDDLFLGGDDDIVELRVVVVVEVEGFGEDNDDDDAKGDRDVLEESGATPPVVSSKPSSLLFASTKQGVESLGRIGKLSVGSSFFILVLLLTLFCLFFAGDATVDVTPFCSFALFSRFLF